MFLISKQTLNLKNGDKQIIKEKIQTPNVESVRAELHRKYECKSITFVFEEKCPEDANTLVPELAN